jgi:hypothetical protein
MCNFRISAGRQRGSESLDKGSRLVLSFHEYLRSRRSYFKVAAFQAWLRTFRFTKADTGRRPDYEQQE